MDAIKDLVQDCNFDCNDSGIALQAMDNSHVALVSMLLKAEGFSPYRCDRNVALGVNLTSLTKVLRAAQNEDILTLKAEDAPDSLNLVFESSENDRISEYDLKLMDIDQEHLGIPETEYAATITMPSAEFRRICTDLMAMSESVTIEATKDGIKFASNGDIGSGSVTLRSHTNVEKPAENIDIELSDPVSLTFSLKYLVNFCKAASLASQVKICLSNEVPLLVEYILSGSSYLRFYLAPKVSFSFIVASYFLMFSFFFFHLFLFPPPPLVLLVSTTYANCKRLATTSKWSTRSDWWDGTKATDRENRTMSNLTLPGQSGRHAGDVGQVGEDPCQHMYV